MKIEQFVIGSLLITALVFGLFTFINGMADEYGVEYDDSFKDTFDNSNAQIEELNSSVTTLFGGDDRLDPSDLAAGITIVWNVLQIIIVTPLTLINDVIAVTMTTLGLPTWFNTFIIGTLIVMLTFALVAALWKWRA